MADSKSISGLYIGDTPIEHATPEERDALARRILTALYEIAARDKGYVLESVHIYKRGEKERT